MASTLYVETHFAIAVAKGQDRSADEFLKDEASAIRLVVPSVCFMEALTVLKAEQTNKAKLRVDLLRYLKEVDRDSTSTHAPHLSGALQEAADRIAKRTNDVENRLYDALERLAGRAEIISLNKIMVENGLRANVIEEDITDNLILACIFHHAQSSPDGPKAFVSGNYREFGKPEVEEDLATVGVRYFKDTRSALGWLNSQGRPAGERPAENPPHPEGPASES